MIRPAAIADAQSIADIYNPYVLNSVASFEEAAVSTGQMEERLRNVSTCDLPWLIAEQHGEVLGFAYAAPWKSRSAYRFTAEITIYLKESAVGQKLGSQLYEALFALLKTKGIHVVLACIALPNPASVALHEKMDMRKTADFSETGFKFDHWVDIGYWQRNL